MNYLLRQNVIAGGFYLILGLLIVFVLIPIGVDEPSNVQYAPLAPSYWPRIICFALAVLGIAMLIRSVMQIRSGWASGEAPEDAPEARLIWRAGVVIALGFALYAVLETLGFVLATAIVLVVLMLFAGERRLQIILPVAAGVPLALYFFFVKAASIPIPAGILESVLVGG